MARVRKNRFVWLGALWVPAVCLVTLSVAAFWGVAANEFVFYDDPAYIYQNPHISKGLSWNTVRWAFNVGYETNWHPLTWISHALDVDLFGVRPAGHHLANLGLHIVTSLLLLLFLTFTTGERWRSAFVAGLFAVHPLHVESVAWASERKDVLSAFVMMLTLLVYSGYARKPGSLRYLGVLVLTALGLMAKPMLVSLPVVLLLLDYWPLRRAERFSRLMAEKLPLFALSVASSAVTVLAQRAAIVDMERIPLAARLSNALVSYAAYLWKMIWPAGLAVHYPFAKTLPGWHVAASALALAGISCLVWILGRGRRYLAIGWLWYLITLIPVIGIVQVGSQAMADRYTYIPLIGVFIVLSWGVPDALAGIGLSRRASAALCAYVAVVVLGILSVVSHNQASYWRNSVKLFERAVSVNPDDAVPHSNLVTLMVRKNELKRAEYHARRAVSIEPKSPKNLAKLAWVLSLQQRLPLAYEYAELAINAAPGYAPAHYQMACILDDLGDVSGAQTAYQRALWLKPDYAEAHGNLANILLRLGDSEGAVRHCEAALRTAPNLAEVHGTMAIALCLQGRFGRALVHAEICSKLGVELPPELVGEIRRRAAESGD